jgi:hypothetical protein
MVKMGLTGNAPPLYQKWCNKRKERMSRQDEHFRLRLPSDLKEFVREQARENQRSMTGEIVFALGQYRKAASGQAS